MPLQGRCVQLLRAGHRSVRVVVTCQQPGAAPLADDSWQLTPSTAAAAAQDLSLPLQLQLSQNTQQQQGRQALALSVVVLAGSMQSSTTHNAAPADALSPAGAADAATAASTSQASAAILAKLPLLVLPAGAAAELQQLAAGMVLEGLQPAAAYQELLPLLQDFAVVLSSSSSSSGTHRHGSAEGSQQQQQQHRQQHLLGAVAAALLDCFEQHGLAECAKLLTNCAGTAAQAVALRVEQSSSNSKEADVAGNAAAEGAAEAASSKLWSSKSLQDDCAGCAPVSSSSSSSSMGSAASCKPSSSSNTNAGQEATGCSTGVQQQQQSGQPASDAGTLVVCYKTLLFGFPAAVEPAYLAYKAAALRSTDFLSVLSYGVGLTATAVKLMCSMADSRMLRIMVLQAGFLFIHAVTHFLIWAAGAGVPQLVALQQWRNTVLAGSATLAICMFAATSLRGGIWAAASLADRLGEEPGVLYWVFVVYRHVMQPLRLRIGLLKSLLLAVEYLVLDHITHLYVKPRLPWLGAAGTAVLMVALHLAIAARLELGMRKSFVRSM
jgi:hypothetical protein